MSIKKSVWGKGTFSLLKHLIISHQGQKFGLAREGVLKQFSESDLCPCFKLKTLLYSFNIFYSLFVSSYFVYFLCLCQCSRSCGSHGVKLRYVQCVFSKSLKPAKGQCGWQEKPSLQEPCNRKTCARGKCLSYWCANAENLKELCHKIDQNSNSGNCHYTERNIKSNRSNS